MNKIVYILLIFLFLSSCLEKKTYLSDEIRKFVPYEEGQELTFVSNKDLENIITITKIEDNKFPDGIGAPDNEILTVYANRQPDSLNKVRHMTLLTQFAKTENKEERLIFELILSNGGMTQRVPFSIVKERKPKTFTNRFNEFDDVIKLEIDYNIEPRVWQITEFYWSLSKGYIRLIQHDGTMWDLKSIKSR